MVRNIAAVIVATLVVLSVQVNAQLSTFLSAGDIRGIQHKAQEILAQPKCLQGAYYALNFLKSSGSNDILCNCNALNELLSSTNAAYDVYYAKNMDACNCGFSITSELETVVHKEFQVFHC